MSGNLLMAARLAVGFAAGSAIDTVGIRVTGPGASVNANAKFEGGHLAQLQAPAVRIGPQNDFSLTLPRGAAASLVSAAPHCRGHGKSEDPGKFPAGFGNVARFIAAFVTAPRAGEVYNLGGGKANSASILEAFALAEKFTGKRQVHTYVAEARAGDHICYYSDLRKMRAHYPQWDITVSLEETVRQIVEAWKQRR